MAISECIGKNDIWLKSGRRSIASTLYALARLFAWGSAFFRGPCAIGKRAFSNSSKRDRAVRQIRDWQTRDRFRPPSGVAKGPRRSL